MTLFPAGWSVAGQSVYERMATADLVVRVRTIEGSLRLAECRVLEVLKGKYSRKQIFIAFRFDNMNRQHYRDRISFLDGQESILLLTPVLDAKLKVKAPDRFRLVGAFKGKIDLPPEGAEAFIRAFRRLGQILQMTDIHRIWNSHRALLSETNPYLVETGFAEVLKFRLGNAGMVPVLLDYLDSKHDPFRISALKVLAQILEHSRRHDEPLPGLDDLVARVLTSALEDPVSAIRVAAVQALEAYGERDIVEVLRQVAERDPSQDVRYEASVSVYRLNHNDMTSSLEHR
ncbi:MAG: HEAT repeat domain-containing protein [Acidobacteriota bacterium]